MGVKATGRFVGKDHLRVIYERSCRSCALPFSSGELIRAMVKSVAKTKAGKDLGGSRHGFSAAFPCDHCGESDIFSDRKLREELMELKNESHIGVSELGEGRWFHLYDVNTVIYDAAGVGTLKGADDLEQSRFSGSAGTDDGKELSIGDGEADIVEHTEPVKALCYVMYLNHAATSDGEATQGVEQFTIDRLVIFNSLGEGDIADLIVADADHDIALVLYERIYGG